MTDTNPDPAAPDRLTRRPGTRALTAVLIAGVCAFGVLAVLVAVHWTPLIGLDTATTSAAYHAASATGWLRACARVATALGSPATVDVVSACVVLGLVLARRWSPALAVAAARVGELGVESAVKVLLDRQRPAFTPPLTTATGASFPSGHSAGSAAVYGVLLLLVVPPLAGHLLRLVATAVAMLLVLAVAASRLLLGVHYLSDVVAGLALGGACAAAAVLIARAVRRTDRRPRTRAD